MLTPQETEGLFAILKSLRDQGRTVFVITHKLAEVFSHCDTWFALRAGRATGSGDVVNSKMEEVVRAMVGSDVPPLAARKPAQTGQSDFEISHA